MNIETVEERWLRFQAKVISPDAPPIQHHEMRIAFYAGVHTMLDACFELADLPQADAVAKLRELHIEALRFGASISRQSVEENDHDS